MSAPRGTLISGAKVAGLRHMALEQGAAVDRRALYDIERRVDEQNFRTHLNLLLGFAAVCLAGYVYLKVASLARTYPAAYEWWESSQAQYGPASESQHPLITVPKMALRVEFPSYYYLQSLGMAAETVSESGAEFLLIMATKFAKYMRPVHWNGTAEELRYTDLELFLPIDKGKDWGYIWSSWDAKNAAGEYVNPWAGVLFTSYEAMANSPAFEAYYANPPDRRYVQALFRGGLAEIAITLGSTDTTGPKMAQHLMGLQSGSYKVPCNNRADQATQKALYYGSMTAMAGGMLGHATMKAAASGGFRGMFMKALPLLITAGGLTAGAVTGAQECKVYSTGYSGQGAGKSV